MKSRYRFLSFRLFQNAAHSFKIRVEKDGKGKQRIYKNINIICLFVCLFLLFGTIFRSNRVHCLCQN